MLKFLATAVTANTDAAKMFKVRRIMVTFWIKENQLANVLEEPDNENVVINELKSALHCHKNLGESHARGALGSKVIKVKNRSRSVLRMIKVTFSLGMRPTKLR